MHEKLMHKLLNKKYGHSYYVAYQSPVKCTV